MSPTNLKKIKSFKCQQQAVRSVRFNYDGEYCITSGSDKSVKLWNPYKELLLKTYNGHRSDVLEAIGSHDNSHIVSCGKDKLVLLFDVTQAESIRSFRGHTGPVNCVKFNLDSSVVASGSQDCRVKLWDMKSRSRDPIQELICNDSVSSLSISDNCILVGSLDGKIRLYDLRFCTVSLDNIKFPVGCINFTYDGQCILASCLNHSLLLIDKETGEILQVFKGHVNSNYRIDSILFKNDEFVLSGSEDGFVYVWSLTEGNIVEKLPMYSHRVIHSLSSHKEKKQFVLMAAEGTVYLWSAADEQE